MSKSIGLVSRATCVDCSFRVEAQDHIEAWKHLELHRKLTGHKG